MTDQSPATDLHAQPIAGGSRGRFIRALAADRRIRFLATGGVAALIYYVIFSAGWLLFSEWIPYLVMAVIANFLTGILTYPLYRVAVFQSKGPWLSGFFRFYLVYLGGLASSLIGLPLLVEVLHIHVLISQAIILIATPLISYQVHRVWTFRHRS